MNPRRRLIWSFVSALVVAAVLSQRVYVQCHVTRIKLVRAAIAGKTIESDLPDTPRLAMLRAPMVLIVNAHANSNMEGHAVSITCRGRVIGDITLKQSERRTDLVWSTSAPLAVGETIQLRADGDWTLDYLELANVHGGSTGPFSLVLVPAAAADYEGLPAAAVVLIASVVGWLFWLGLGASGRMALFGRWSAAVLGLLAALSLASGLLVHYKILWAVDTVVRGLLLLCLPGLVKLYGLRVALPVRVHHTAASVVCGGLVCAFYGLLASQMLIPYQGNPSGLLQIARTNVERMPVLAERADLRDRLVMQEYGGYDGQFMYFIALDPLLQRNQREPARYRAYIDSPPYRYHRIGYPALTWLLTAGRPELFPAAMVILIVAAHGIAAAFLAAIAQHYGRHPAWALLYLMVPGFVPSLHVALPESVACAGMLAGLWCVLKGRYWLAVAPLAVALLTRETSGALVVALIVWLWIKERKAREALTVASALLPFVLWRAYVCWSLFPDYGWKGLWDNPNNLGVPFLGFVDLWRQIAQGIYYPDAGRLAVAGVVYPLLLIAGLVLAILAVRRTQGPVAWAAAIYGVAAVSLNYESIWVHVGNGERGTYELFVMLLVAFLSWPIMARRQRAAALALFACLCLYTGWVTFDAPIVQRVLLLPFA